MIRTTAVCASAAIAASALAAEVGYYSQPALHGDRLIFASEGDLWTATIPAVNESAASAPIVAHRLTSSDGAESRPCISPDGQWVAFTAQYDGNVDVYAMPIDGGPPRRLTFHPDPDTALAWTPDGNSVLFSSPRTQQFGRPELWRVSIAGGPATRYEFGECSMIAMSSTGKRVAFTRWSNETWTWKRYRGGTAPEIWLGDLSAGTFALLTKDPANDLFPMWVLDRVFFLSDRTGTANIFSASANADSPDFKQHTSFASDASNPTAVEGYDVRWPSADTKRRGTAIVFSQGGALAMLETTSNAVRRLDVRLASDRVAARQRFAALNETITEFALSPDGKTLLVGSRGELMSFNVDGGAARQLTHTSNAREWGAVWLGNDKLGMISDAGGEQQIAVAPADGSALPGLLTEDREDWLFPPTASPDGKWIAFADKTLRLHILEMRNFEKRQIDQSEAGEITDYRFSADSQWLAYVKPMPNGMGMIHVYSVRSGRSFPVSTGLYNDDEPRWDPAGKYLYFLSNRHLNPMMGGVDFEHVFLNTTEVFAVPLASDTPPPIKEVARSAGFDLEKWAAAPDQKDKQKEADVNDAEEPVEPPAPPQDPNAAPADAMRVDTDGLNVRHHQLPIESGNYANLEAQWGAITYISNKTLGLMDDPWPNPAAPQGTLHRYDLVKAKDKALAEKLNAYAISRDAKTIAYPIVDEKAQITAFNMIPATGEGDEPKSIDVAAQQLRMDVAAEWKQILNEAWRLQRDFYWAPNYTGVNWTAMRAKYESLLPRIGSRVELNDLIGQMIGELGTSHTYIWGGQEHDQIKAVGVGMLGADIAFDGQGFRIVRIIPGQPWGEGFVSPLEAAHLSVEAGNYLTSINGVQIAATSDLFDLLQDQAGKLVRLTIADDARGTNARTIEVKTLSNERPLRYAAWVEANRKYVDEKSGGKLGYLHIPDMGGEGLVMFSRYFYPQFTKQGLVIDIRDNGGGFVSQMIVQRLARKVWAFMEPRHGVRERFPQRTVHGHLAVIIDQHAGSDGDIFPASFKMLGLGPLIGTRTWGGVVGIRGDKPFVDRGLSTQPEFAWWEPKDGWSIENQGVSPDIEVQITPADRVEGKDPQLDRAIGYLLDKLEKEPMELPKRPDWPVRVK